MEKEKILEEIIALSPKSKEELERVKKIVAKKFHLPLPDNISLLSIYQELIKKKSMGENERWVELFRKRPVRSLSGIVNITILTKPYPCPAHCIFCPTENGIPKSYISGEPAVERARSLNYDPYLQVKKRIEMLKKEGHATDKIELRIVGGTWSYYPLDYRFWFIKRAFDAANERESKNIFEAQRINENAKNRIVGISIETRPDFITEEEIKNLRYMGVTLVEMGVQSLLEDLLWINGTNLNLLKIASATRLLKNHGFKVLYHLMLNLLGSNPEKDLQSFKIAFNDERFKPDWVKIYPLLLTEHTPIYFLWKRGLYQPYPEDTLVKTIIKIKREMPVWVRITRIVRDIPSEKIVAGCKKSNLREVVKREMEKIRMRCQCIRCREIRERYHAREKIYLFREDYDSCGGKEIFLSFEDKERRKLFSFLRLRIPNDNSPLFSVLKNSAIIREIQTFGEQVPIAERRQAPQHQGLGTRLVKEAERIAKNEFMLKRTCVIAGVGVRGYFRKLGYSLRETFMVKNL